MNSISNLELEELINKYSNYLYTTITNTANGNLIEEDIEEIIADTFFILWRNRENIDTNRDVRFYLAGISKNLVRQKFRKLKIDYNIDDYEVFLIDNMEDYEKREKERIIDGQLNKISEIDRKIFIMFYYNSNKIKEIAEQLDISEISVKTNLFMIRKKIKKELERQGYSYGE